MLYHAKCGCILKIDVTKSVRVLADFSVTGKYTAKPTKIELMKVTGDRITIDYFCKKCNRVVTKDEEMISSCDGCGKAHDSKEMEIPEESGGFFCPKCIKRFSEEKTYN